jgi:pimeloyl-ACP methyl ester carboxylesterase
LVLLHGIGMSHAAWRPVTPALCRTRRVIAFDIAGFGLTPPLATGTAPTIAHLVDDLDRSIRELGLELPVDIVGNSLGGAMALEAARRGMARTVVGLSPIGLWNEHPPGHVKYVFRGLRLMAGTFPTLVRSTMRVPLLRELALAVPLSAGSGRMPVCDALRAVDDLAASPGFEATFAHTRAPFSGVDITVPVTVAFGDRDWILTKGARQRDHLPPHTRWIAMPRWGHVPMWVDPAGVARLILEDTHERSQ